MDGVADAVDEEVALGVEETVLLGVAETVDDRVALGVADAVLLGVLDGLSPRLLMTKVNDPIVAQSGYASWVKADFRTWTLFHPSSNVPQSLAANW